MSHTSTKAKTTTKAPGPFVVEMTFAQIKPAMAAQRAGSKCPRSPRKGATRTLVRERRLEGRDGVLRAGAASSLKVVLDEIADGSGVVDVDGSGRKAGVEGLTRQGLVAGKGQRAAIDRSSELLPRRRSTPERATTMLSKPSVL